jgi:hypothetical protein
MCARTTFSPSRQNLPNNPLHVMVISHYVSDNLGKAGFITRVIYSPES